MGHEGGFFSLVFARFLFYSLIDTLVRFARVRRAFTARCRLFSFGIVWRTSSILPNEVRFTDRSGKSFVFSKDVGRSSKILKDYHIGEEHRRGLREDAEVCVFLQQGQVVN